MTNYITRAERRKAQDWLNKFVQAGQGDFTVQRYQRLNLWLEGYTFKEIAKEEGVTPQAVSKTVHQDYETVKKFALNNDKR